MIIITLLEYDNDESPMIGTISAETKGEVLEKCIIAIIEHFDEKVCGTYNLYDMIGRADKTAKKQFAEIETEEGMRTIEIHKTSIF